MNRWHILTGEYPPASGGVGDYTYLVARGLAQACDEVHVWCPEAPGGVPSAAGVEVHPILGAIAPSNLRRLARELDRFDAPRRLLVQWVPHAWGWRSMNLAFCEWLWRRARQGDHIDVVAHEPFLGFWEGGLKQQAAAAVHRVMVTAMLRAARRVWVTIPAWKRALRPYAPRRVVFDVLPVPSTVPVVSDPAAVQQVRAATVPPGTLLVGHFGTYGTPIVKALEPVVAELARDNTRVLLLGRGGEAARRALIERHGEGLGAFVIAPGALDAASLSLHLQACDIVVQPFPDGASGRRTSLMAALAHGRAVVTTIGRLSEPLWQESGAVAAVPSGDDAALAAAVNRLRADAAERARLGAAAAALYDERFDVRHTVERLRGEL